MATAPAARRSTMALDSTLTRHDSLMPQRPGGLRKGTAMALLVHVGLLIALAFGVSWRSQTPAGVSAELWSAVPQVAAPKAVEPKPTPAPTPPAPAPTPKTQEAPPKPSQVDAQIAIEKEKAERKQRELQEQQERERKEQERKEQERKDQLRKEQERLEREKAEKLAAQRQRELELKRQKEEEARVAKQREDYLKRMQSQAGTGAPDAAGTAVRDAGPSASYAGKIILAVKPNIVWTDDLPGNPVARVEVRCAPDGTIMSRRIVRSSGNKDWDDAVVRAIDKTGTLPRDVDGRVPSPIEIDFRPREL